MTRRFSETTITPAIGLVAACDEIARRTLLMEPTEAHSTIEDRVVGVLDALTAQETCCVLGALRNLIGRDLPLVEIYRMAVPLLASHYERAFDVPS